jgi:hypothetical protein
MDADVLRPMKRSHQPMSEATEIVPEKSQSALVKVAGAGMALLGSSTAGTALVGGSVAHADHGHSPARWWGASLSFAGWLVGGVLFPFAAVPAVIIGGVFQIAAMIAALALNAAGYGRPDVWGELKAKAAADRAAVGHTAA